VPAKNPKCVDCARVDGDDGDNGEGDSGDLGDGLGDLCVTSLNFDGDRDSDRRKDLTAEVIST
jgi:hypothetical protein